MRFQCHCLAALAAVHHEAICRTPIAQCSTKVNCAAVFCFHVLWMSCGRAGTESRARKENPVIALWVSCVLSHLKFSDASHRKWVWWRAAVQVVGLDLSQSTQKFSWQWGRCQWDKHCWARPPGSASPGELLPLGWVNPSVQACFWCSVVFLLVVLKILETKFHPLTAGQFSCRFLCASASSAHQKQSLKELQHPSLCFCFLWTLQVIPLSGWNCSHLRQAQRFCLGVVRGFLTKWIWIFLSYTRREIFFKGRQNILLRNIWR